MTPQEFLRTLFDLGYKNLGTITDLDGEVSVFVGLPENLSLINLAHWFLEMDRIASKYRRIPKVEFEYSHIVFEPMD